MMTVDNVFLIIVLISIFVGFFRGFIREIISIFSLLAAIWVSINYGGSVGSYFDAWFVNPSGQLWAGMIVSFLVIIILGMIVARILSRIFRLSLSAKIDRVLGAVFGFFRGCILTAILVLGGQLTSAVEADWWKDSNYIPYSKIIADKLIEYIPRNIEFVEDS